MSRRLCLTLAAISAAGFLAGCEADDSLPTRPRTANFLTPDSRAQDNAEHRALEKPAEQLPASGSEFPGQSNAAPIRGGGVLTLDAAATSPAKTSAPTGMQCPISGFVGPRGWDAIGHTQGPTTVYNNDTYKGSIPHLPDNPGTVPMAGTVKAPDADWNIDFSWGQGLTLKDYPHRPWAPTTAEYQDGAVKHDPAYFFNLTDHTTLPAASGPRTAEIRNTLIDTAWFFVNVLELPKLMLLEPPLAQRLTDRTSADPNFRGSIPTGGPVVPAPVTGTLRWDYPFLNPDGTVKPAKDLPRSSQTVPMP